MATEFVVVGGGAYGCATAYQLASRGASVRIVEAGGIAQGASGGLGKRGVRANRRDFRELPLMVEAYDMWPNLAAMLGAPTGYERTGGVYLVEREAVGVSGGLVAGAAYAEVQRAFGVPTELWGPEQVSDVMPGVSDRVKAGLYAPLDGVASHAATTEAYAAAARACGTEITEHSAVVSVRSQAGGGATLHTSQGERISASRAVLLANNAGAAAITQQSFGRRVPLWSVYPQAVTLRASSPFTIPLLTGHDHRALSVKTLEDDLIMLSGGWRGRFDPQARRGVIDPAAVKGNIEELSAVFPHLGELSVVETDASRAESVSADQVPLIGEIAGSVYLAAGWSGHGWALVPSASRHIAQLLLEGEYSPELKPLALSRIPSASRS